MDKARLLEILSREHKKLEDGGVEWLREYGANAQRDLGFTFYMICRVLAYTTEARPLSTYVQEQITTYMKTNGVEFAKKWNPVAWYLNKWASQEGAGLKNWTTQHFVIPKQSLTLDTGR